jgi:hypothetical protein
MDATTREIPSSSHLVNRSRQFVLLIVVQTSGHTEDPFQRRALVQGRQTPSASGTRSSTASTRKGWLAGGGENAVPESSLRVDLRALSRSTNVGRLGERFAGRSTQ